MTLHTPYQKRLKRSPDFIVEYVIAPEKELGGGKPTQGMRLDFLYSGDDPAVDGIHMIWPEILNEKGEVLLDTTPGIVSIKGKANMWVVDETFRSNHSMRLKVGTKGYWVRGSLRVARVTVLEIGSLKELWD